MMKIVFQGSEYQLDTLDDLRQRYPEASKLLDFIQDWQQGKPSYEFQTSGSTSSPKVIDVNREQIVASARATGQFLELKKSDQVLCCLDPQFVASLMMAARCLIWNMDLALEKPSANPMTAIKNQIDFASFVPFQVYQMIADNNLHQLENIRNVLIGGAPLTPAAFGTLAQLNTNIYATYGMTETVSHIALMPVKGKYSQAYYHLLPNIVIGQDDEQCLKVSGAVTNHNTLQTNDIVEITGRTFRWLGRRDHVINSGGIKIHPEQLERKIANLLSSDFFISWQANEKLGNECILITKGAPMAIEKLEEIQKVVTEAFSKHHAPKRAVNVDTFEHTASGKIKREETRIKALKLGQLG
ncbi:AMP-binding protein [Reichenbachiella carrageenanivorans]|uniref:AMP-binding protein n=1 Tax=Reichenbachiella carrageenanivorans TaxID=2979869 RepID=A0ABY6CZN5_9BACT|nr:AMP-binding protein [Reichenbachiella carrageenanivorans]UXX79328.1 AMP-binding protein [Reichenbachiella carrageenanivorans]